MGIANKVAGALGSLIFGALLLSGIDEVKEKCDLEKKKHFWNFLLRKLNDN